MMKRDLFSMLQYEAKRDPVLADLVANVNSMTDEQIDAAKVKLPWIRQALKATKSKNRYEELTAYVYARAIDTRSPDPIGEVREWIGGDAYISIGRNQLEIRTGQLIWIGSDIWIDTIKVTKVDPRVHSETKTFGMMTRSAYMETIRERVRGQMPTEPVSTYDPKNPLSGIRIYRPQ